MGQSIKVSTSSPVEVLPFHKDVFATVRTASKAVATMGNKLRALLVSRYGETSPTFEQYRADQKALAELSREKGLTDNQYARKCYAAAVKSQYGALPESQDPEALRKAAARKAAASTAPAAAPAPVGAPAGQTQDRQPTESEQIEALITRIGLFKALDACIRILEADEKTKAQAMHLRKMASKAAEATKG